MPTLGEYLTTLCTNANIPQDVQTQLLTADTTLSAELPKDVEKQLNSTLLTVESARANQALKNHFYAEALDGVDKVVNESIESLGLSESVLKEITGSSSTYDRVKLSVKAMNDLKGSLLKKIDEGATEDPEIKAKLQAQDKTIDDLNKQMAGIKGQHDSEREKLIGSHKQEQLNWKLQSDLSNNITREWEDLSKDDVGSLAMQKVVGEANRRGYKISLSEANQIEITNADGTKPFSDNNTPVRWDTFRDTTLSDNGFIKQTNSTVTPGNQQQTVAPQNGNGMPQMAGDWDQ